MKGTNVPAPSRRIEALQFVMIFALAMLVCLAIRSWVIQAVNLDPGVYLSVASLIDKGNILYLQVPESKPPLFHFINASVVYFVGQSFLATQIVMMGVSSLTAAVLFLLMRKLEYGTPSALIAAVFLAVFTSLPISEMEWVMTEP